MTVITFVDSEAAVRAWINANASLTGGTAPPLSQGAHLKRLDSVRGTYVRLLLINTTTGMTAETPIQLARISGTIYGGKKDTAEVGARAYANELWSLILTGKIPCAMGSATCRGVDNITGPLPIDDFESTHEQYRYMVDASFYLTP
jgi:hypothetical protein